MNKLKLFIENFLVYGLGGIISKIIPLIMLPIITRLMPDSSYFGISDMSNTIISFASALAIIGMYDAMYRIFFEREDEEYKKDVCSTTLVFTIASSVIVFFILLIFKNQMANIFFSSKGYASIMYITAIATLVTATNNIISAPTRMQNKKVVYLLVNAISSILSYSIAIPLLLKGYYAIALPLASAISGIIIEITFAILNKQWFSIKRFDYKLLKQMLIIAIPLFPNFLIYWIFNSSDKVMITNMLGIAETGIYSAGSKLGHISQLIYTAFAGGWQYFAFSTMKEKKQVESNSLIFEYLGIISYIATMFMCVFSKTIFNMLFTEEYWRGYIITPYLFMAPLLQMLFQVACNQFLVIKKTWPNLLILSTGAIINIIINLNLIPVLGIEGAAIATLIGYIISDVICVIVLIKMKLMVISKRFLIVTLITILFLIVWRIVLINSTIINAMVVLMITIFFGALHKNEIFTLVKALKKGKKEIANE